MKKIFVVLFLSFFSVPFFFGQVEFSGSIGGALFFATEKIPEERIVMQHRAAGVTANLYALSSINLGLWVKIDYFVPFFYSLQSEEQDLSYAFTEAIDFSVGPAYLFRITDFFSIYAAAGFNVIQMILAPRISSSFGMAVDTALRFSFLSAFSVNLGASLEFSFSMQLMSAATTYKNYSLVSFRPYLSIGWIGSTPSFGAKKSYSSRISSTSRQPKQVETPKPAETPKSTETPKPAETPKATETPKPETPIDDGEQFISEDVKQIIDTFMASVRASGINDIEVAPSSVGITLTLEKTKFQSGKAVLLISEKERIKKVSELLEKFGGSEISIACHVDSRGSEEYQINLSKERATAVANEIITLNVASADKITAMGLGSSESVADNNTLDGLERNNRIEITIFYGEM